MLVSVSTCCLEKGCLPLIGTGREHRTCLALWPEATLVLPVSLPNLNDPHWDKPAGSAGSATPACHFQTDCLFALGLGAPTVTAPMAIHITGQADAPAAPLRDTRKLVLESTVAMRAGVPTRPLVAQVAAQGSSLSLDASPTVIVPLAIRAQKSWPCNTPSCVTHGD